MLALLSPTEAEGFEPPVPLRARRFSRPVQSTALPRLPTRLSIQYRPERGKPEVLGGPMKKPGVENVRARPWIIESPDCYQL